MHLWIWSRQCLYITKKFEISSFQWCIIHFPTTNQSRAIKFQRYPIFPIGSYGAHNYLKGLSIGHRAYMENPYMIVLPFPPTLRTTSPSEWLAQLTLFLVLADFRQTCWQISASLPKILCQCIMHFLNIFSHFLYLLLSSLYYIYIIHITIFSANPDLKFCHLCACQCLWQYVNKPFAASILLYLIWVGFSLSLYSDLLGLAAFLAGSGIF